MMRLAEISVFFAAASALHVAAWLSFPQAGTQSAGASGDATISLAAASAEVADLVAAWARPVEVMVTPQTPPEISAPTETALKPIPQPAPAQPTRLQSPQHLPVVIRRPDTLPAADTKPATPAPPDTGPEASLRPQSRPLDSSVELTEATKPPAQKQAQQAPAVQEQTASLGQTGRNSGSTKTQLPSTRTTAQQKSLMAQWGAAIRSSVERRKSYPRGAQAKGTAKLRLTLSSRGRLLDVRLLTSSGDAALDSAAIAAVKRAKFPAAPGGLSQPQYQFNLPVSFQ